ncbi:MAG: Hpt domain-containing protein, partial [Lachnospiraceae bacterium]|nr:Hpt domain-containing protein [Lachnospiraceae bacterium]
IKDYEIKIHSLKSSANTIGALKMGEMALQLELAAKNNDTEFIQKNHAAFIDEFKNIKAVLDEIFS